MGALANRAANLYAPGPVHESRTSDARVIPVAYVTFGALGLTSGLLGLAWPSMRARYGLALDSVNQIFVASTIAYTTASFFAGRLMGRWGSGATLLAGAGLLGASMFAIAAAGTWPQVVFLCGLAGVGSGVIDAGLNLYLATYHAPRQMSWLHASFGIGSTAGPLVMTAVLDSGLGWQAGYAAGGAAMAVPVALLAMTRRSWQGDRPTESAALSSRRASFAHSIGVPAVWIGVAAFVCCVGLEVSAGQWAYTLLVDSRGMRHDPAGVMVSAYWGTFTAGRILFGFLPGRIDAMRLLPWLAGAMVVGAVLFWRGAVPGLLLLGFAEAPVFPLLMAGTVGRVNARHAENAVAFQMVGSGVAAALVPGLIGTAGKRFGLEAMSLCLAVLSVLAFVFCTMSVIAARRTPSPRPAGLPQQA